MQALLLRVVCQCCLLKKDQLIVVSHRGYIKLKVAHRDFFLSSKSSKAPFYWDVWSSTHSQYCHCLWFWSSNDIGCNLKDIFRAPVFVQNVYDMCTNKYCVLLGGKHFGVPYLQYCILNLFADSDIQYRHFKLIRTVYGWGSAFWRLLSYCLLTPTETQSFWMSLWAALVVRFAHFDTWKKGSMLESFIIFRHKCAWDGWKRQPRSHKEEDRRHFRL